jgi:hypothetical protein
VRTEPSKESEEVRDQAQRAYRPRFLHLRLVCLSCLVLSWSPLNIMTLLLTFEQAPLHLRTFAKRPPTTPWVKELRRGLLGFRTFLRLQNVQLIQEKTRHNGKTRQNKTNQDKARQNKSKTRQDKTRQGEATQDKTRQTKSKTNQEQDKARQGKTKQTKQGKARQRKTRQVDKPIQNEVTRQGKAK